MPKNEIDYSKTIIYKIVCKDKTINDVYVGHTTSFIKRKYQHKLCCNNLNNKIKIYEVIRANGGWDNWEMIEIATYNCNNSEEARIKEQEHYEEIIKPLNAVKPYSDSLNHTFFCKKCEYSTSNKKAFNRHLSTVKHSRMTQELQINDIKLQKDDAGDDIEDDNNLKKSHYKCDCGNIYKYRQGLWKHKKICEIKKAQENSNQKEDYTDKQETELKVITKLVKDVIKQNIDVIKQNQDLTNKIVDICKVGNTQNNTISYSNLHSNNTTFNLQFFLNETCKDAMNISDFVESIKFQLKDLEHIGEVGFVDGISDVVLDNLTELDTRQRPIHCSDNKREILYIKDNDEWIKDDEPNTKMTKVIKQIAHKNMKNIPEWIKNNPDCHKSDSKKNDKYLKIVSNSMSGCTELEQKNNINKIISKVAKEVTIDKNKYQLK
jgi:hypothetical protein